MHAIEDLLNLAGRIFIAAIFVISGIGKIGAYDATEAYMVASGVPAGLLPVVIAFEILAGLAVAVGLFARPAAFLLAGFSLVAAVLFHADFADPVQSILFWKNVAIAGGFLFIVVHGAGPWSVDQRRSAGPRQ